MRVATCLFTEHNLWLVVLAAVVCISGSAIGFGLFDRAQERQGQERYGWAFLAAVAAGSSVWCTHFIAMLAYDVKADVVFDPMLTMISLLIIIAGCGAGFSLGARYRRGLWPYACGAIVGLSISVMHYVGMAAYRVSGIVEWDPAYVLVSVLISATVSALAMRESVARVRKHSTIIAVGLFVLAVVALHFTGMAAMIVYPDGANSSIDKEGFAALAMAVAGVGLLIIGTGITSYMIDARVSQDAHSRLQAFIRHAPAAVAMFDRDMRYIAHTDRWLQDYGLDAAPLDGRSHYDVFPEVPEHWRQKHQRILKGNVEKSEEERFLRADGAEQIIRWEVRPWTFSDGRIGGIMMLTEEISERKRVEERLWRLAKMDTLTSLPNRFHFSEQLEQTIKQAEQDDLQAAVIGIDLNRFKEINDHRGHKAGDFVLTSLGSRLMAMKDTGEFIARIGGNEFAAIKTYRDVSDLHAFISRIEAILSEPIFYEGVSLVTGGSIGVALFPSDAREADKLVSNADLAMYRAKADNARTVCFYDKAMDEAARERSLISRDLELAIDRGELELHYQVQNDLQTSEIIGYEVLLRWRHATLGYISPVMFIPIAEESGAIVAIGEWVLRMACREAAGWNNDCKIAVNVSAVQLAHGDLTEIVSEILATTGLSPSRLELELTETAIVADKVRSLHLIRQIKALGVTIAIDDFGAGYSSLDTLRLFPFDKIKLDRSFMDELDTDLQSKAIMRAVVALARSLDKRVLAEGVETPEQLAILREEGCDEAQGYLLGRPAPAAIALGEIEPARMDADIPEALAS